MLLENVTVLFTEIERNVELLAASQFSNKEIGFELADVANGSIYAFRGQSGSG